MYSCLLLAGGPLVSSRIFTRATCPGHVWRMVPELPLPRSSSVTNCLVAHAQAFPILRPPIVAVLPHCHYAVYLSSAHCFRPCTIFHAIASSLVRVCLFEVHATLRFHNCFVDWFRSSSSDGDTDRRQKTADLGKLRCLIHDHIPMVNPMTFPLEGPFAGGGWRPPPHPHTRHVPRARLADGTPAASFKSFFGIGSLFFFFGLGLPHLIVPSWYIFQNKI